MTPIERLLDRARCSGIDHFTRDELAIMRAHLETLPPAERVREIYPHGDRIEEEAVDRVWSHLGHEPTADEYRELASVLKEAAEKCLMRANAAEVPS